MAEKRQKKQAAKAFEKETFSMDKEVTGANHTENRQDNIFSTESQFHANEKPVSNLPRDANHGSRQISDRHQDLQNYEYQAGGIGAEGGRNIKWQKKDRRSRQ